MSGNNAVAGSEEYDSIVNDLLNGITEEINNIIGDYTSEGDD